MLVVCGPTSNGLGHSDEMSVVCAGCGGKIVDRYYLLAVDRRWHVRCLTCSQCNIRLDSELTCFARDGKIYCKEDYYRLFAVKRCTRCHLAISSNELVMRVREHVYHLHCFTCANCNKALTKGEYFGLKDDIIYCRTHYELMIQYEHPYSHLPNALKDDGGGKTHSEDCGVSCPASCQQFSLGLSQYPSSTTPVKQGPSHKGRPRKQKNLGTQTPVDNDSRNLATPDSCATNSTSQRTTPNILQQTPSSCSSPSGSGSSTISNSEHLPRPKRMRTSFKHHQLRTMKSYFSINHNPDAKDLKQLSQKTGLSKRVLQVWFQNARAKWRRNLLKQQIQGPEVVQDSKPLAEITSHAQFCDVLRANSGLVDIQPTPITQEEQNIQTFTNLI